MWRIPLSDLNYNEQEIEAVKAVLDSGWLTMGPYTADFELAFALRHGVDNAVAVANCTCALELVYRYVLAHAAPDKCAVIVPDITFVATANAVIAAGGEPVLCDIASVQKPFPDLAQLEKLLAQRSDIAAVSVVHYAGIDANVEQTAELCDRHGIPLIEDCAHATGASTASGKPLGSLGLAGCFSFFSNKNLATGEGGMITTNDPNMAAWLKLARSHGVTSSTWSRHTSAAASSYDVQFPGYNCRCTEITAALGLAQLSKLSEGNKKRRDLTLLYNELLQNLDGYHILLPPDEQSHAAAYHILPVLCPDAPSRNNIRHALDDQGIQTSHHYAPIHSFSWYANANESAKGTFPNSIAFAERQLTLPLHPNLPWDQVHEIAKNIIGAAH